MTTAAQVGGLDKATIEQWIMLAHARERWPEMTEDPRVVYAPPGVTGLDIPTYDPDPVQWFEHDDPAWMPPERLERIMAGHPPKEFGFEHIELEPVGPYRMGYGPRSRVLYVGQDAT